MPTRLNKIALLQYIIVFMPMLLQRIGDVVHSCFANILQEAAGYFFCVRGIKGNKTNHHETSPRPCRARVAHPHYKL